MPTPCEDAVSWGPGAADTLLNEENAPEGRAPPDVYVSMYVLLLRTHSVRVLLPRTPPSPLQKCPRGEEEMMHNATATDPARGRLHEVT